MVDTLKEYKVDEALSCANAHYGIAWKPRDKKIPWNYGTACVPYARAEDWCIQMNILYPQLEHALYVEGMDKNTIKLIFPSKCFVYDIRHCIREVTAHSFYSKKIDKVPQPYGWYRKFEKKRF